MKRIRVTVQDEYIDRYPEDIKMIRAAFRSYGFTVTKEQAATMWREHSDSWAAGWLDPSISDSDEIFELLKPYFEVI